MNQVRALHIKTIEPVLIYPLEFYSGISHSPGDSEETEKRVERYQHAFSSAIDYQQAKSQEITNHE